MITKEAYSNRLRECPAYDTPEFIDYLRQNNKVVDENSTWILIENCKYHKPDSGYYTAFFKPETKYRNITPNLLFPTEWSSLFRMYQKYSSGWEFCIKADFDKSIRTRFHIHFIEYGDERKRNKRLGIY